ncbi:cysteine desulfurase family protein [Roseibium suaedae]|uniref:Cysteine desulfurase n=1 Tax=Roseibium suaedae TaxID=735517 RepID=A0A1M7L5K5_9HYPH|nr:cysteine desulfurase family protein [Roseibium suaedae]SHM73159.1 cysteine desulfurase [Roseibium suaedae]
MPTYLDANATTQISSSARDAMVNALNVGPLNPSSAHSSGEQARKLLTAARDDAAKLFGDIFPEDVIFTSGGTEGNWIAIQTFLRLGDTQLISSQIEHPSVANPISTTRNNVLIGVDARGHVKLKELSEALTSSALPTMVSVQWVNSETGVIQPITEIVQLVRDIRPEAFIHVDAAQAVGRVPLDFEGIDFATCSAHKLHGPHGIGLLYVSDHAVERLPGYMNGAGQERGIRPGTENVPAAIGMAAAFTERAENFDQHNAYMQTLRDAFETALKSRLPNIRINGENSPRVGNTSNVCFPGHDAMALIAALDANDILCSFGSACSSGKPEPSKTLLAMGLSETDAYCSVRFSVSIMNTESEIEEAAQVISRVVRDFNDNNGRGIQRTI